RAVIDQLTRFGASRSEAHAVHNVVETGFEQLDKRFTSVATTALGFGKVLAELLLEDRKSTRLNSSHVKISYAVFCLKKKKQPPLSPSPRFQPTIPSPRHS